MRAYHFLRRSCYQIQHHRSMATSSYLPCEGVFAINKPGAISSAQVIRDAQSHFNSSALFKPWMDRELSRKATENHNQTKKRRSWKQRQPLQLKMGHGGTLDPLATGVLILGVGLGTKRLNDFLHCTKSYETIVIFGAATDTYDSVGKVVGRKNYEHVTKEKVEEALEQFRGKIMQRPPIYSALKVQGKKLYEYARAGKEVPVEIEERPVEVTNLEMTEWMDGGTHEYRWPEEEAEKDEKAVVQKVLHLDDTMGTKRKRDDEVRGAEAEHGTSPKRTKSSPAPAEAGEQKEDKSETTPKEPTPATTDQSPSQTKSPCPAPACRIRMTVTSGFYVRALCHDLGAAVSSLGLMASLVRTRQGDFEIGTNVLEYDDLAKGEDVWGPKVQSMLEGWRAREDVPVEEDWEADRVVRNKREAKPKMRARMRRRNTSSAEEDEGEAKAGEEASGQ